MFYLLPDSKNVYHEISLLKDEGKKQKIRVELRNLDNLNNEICRILKPGGINIYTVRHTIDPLYSFNAFSNTARALISK